MSTKCCAAHTLNLRFYLFLFSPMPYGLYVCCNVKQAFYVCCVGKRSSNDKNSFPIEIHEIDSPTKYGSNEYDILVYQCIYGAFRCFVIRHGF